MTVPTRREALAHSVLLAALLALPASCGGSGSGGSGGNEGPPLPPPGGPPELLLIRAHRDQPHRLTDVAKTDARLIAIDTVIDRAGVERDCRIAPDGNRIVYTREVDSGRPQSRELFVATLDGSVREQRLTADSFRDDAPCWSPDGSRLAFVSERLGDGDRLFLIDSDGANQEVAFDDGSEQLTPDWSASDERIVFSRFDPATAPRRTLWILDPVLRRATPLTDGGGGAAAGLVAGDHWPSWSPDGGEVLFVRVLDDQRSVLAKVDVATGAVTELTSTTGGDLRRPRFAPLADRLFYVGDRPDLGIGSRLLWSTGPAGEDPALLFADGRYDLTGLDPLATMPAADPRGTDAGDVDLSDAAIAASVGFRTQGSFDDILVEDDFALGIGTQAFDGRERAGLDLRARLPLADPLDVRRLEISVRARVVDAQGGDILRIAVRNASERRNDTLAELPAEDGIHRITLPISGLSYVDREANVGVAVIADKAGDAPGELLIDWVGVRLVRAVDPPNADGPPVDGSAPQGDGPR
jgi:Tol biopolymer transport system component